MQVYRLKRQYRGQWKELQRWAEENLKGQWMWGSEHMNPTHSYLNEDDQGTMFIDRDEDAVLFSKCWIDIPLGVPKQYEHVFSLDHDNDDWTDIKSWCVQHLQGEWEFRSDRSIYDRDGNPTYYDYDIVEWDASVVMNDDKDAVLFSLRWL
jgi:hypothetical protein